MKLIQNLVSVSLAALMFVASATAVASLAAKKWPASEEARKFVEETIGGGMLSSPYGTGWTKNEQLLTYFKEARDAGIAVTHVFQGSA